MRTQREINKQIAYYDAMIKKYGKLSGKLSEMTAMRNILLWVLNKPPDTSKPPKRPTILDNF